LGNASWPRISQLRHAAWKGGTPRERKGMARLLYRLGLSPFVFRPACYTTFQYVLLVVMVIMICTLGRAIPMSDIVIALSIPCSMLHSICASHILLGIRDYHLKSLNGQYDTVADLLEKADEDIANAVKKPFVVLAIATGDMFPALWPSYWLQPARPRTLPGAPKPRLVGEFITHAHDDSAFAPLR